jgi:hypothetical protein
MVHPVKDFPLDVNTLNSLNASVTAIAAQRLLERRRFIPYCYGLFNDLIRPNFPLFQYASVFLAEDRYVSTVVSLQRFS